MPATDLQRMTLPPRAAVFVGCEPTLPLFYGLTEWSAPNGASAKEGLTRPNANRIWTGSFFRVKTVRWSCARPQFRGFIPAVA